MPECPPGLTPGCCDALPPNIVYFGKNVVITAVSGNPTIATFTINGQGAQQYSVRWGNVAKMWEPCSRTTANVPFGPKVGEAGLLFLSFSWLDDHGVPISGQDPKIPLSLPTAADIRKYFPLDVTIKDICVSFVVNGAANESAECVSITNPRFTLPRHVKDQLAIELESKGTLWVTEKVLSDNAIKPPNTSIQWPELPDDDADNLRKTGVLTDNADGTVSMRPNSIADVRRLYALLTELEREGVDLADPKAMASKLKRKA